MFIQVEKDYIIHLNKEELLALDAALGVACGGLDLEEDDLTEEQRVSHNIYEVVLHLVKEIK